MKKDSEGEKGEGAEEDHQKQRIFITSVSSTCSAAVVRPGVVLQYSG